MKVYQKFSVMALATFFFFHPLIAAETSLPAEMQTIMQQSKYEHSIWGIYAKDLQTGKVLVDQNSNKQFSPASTTKLFSTSALLNVFGDDYRFKTPVYATGQIKDGKLEGNLILVGQGDLTFGGRQSDPNIIDFTKMDHTIANDVPGAILTKQDPLNGLNDLAKQVYLKGVREITGDVLIDDSLFETIQKRGMTLSPLLLNENMIDFVVNPADVNQDATFTYRPHVEGYKVENRVKTVAKGGALDISVTADKTGHHIVLDGTIPVGEKDIVRGFFVQDPKVFARSAFIEALTKQGIKINAPAESKATVPSSYSNLSQLALFTSPPLTEYVKLILKVSHNMGADLVPLLLAAKNNQKTFNEGMLHIGNFISDEVKISPNAYVMIDAAGGNENRFTPQAEIQLLDYIKKLSPAKFQHFYEALPIMGVDGSLADFGKDSPGAGKIRAKPGTGVAMNFATGKLFLITQALSGYVEGKNGHLIAYMIVVNNAKLNNIDDVFGMFGDDSKLSSILYNLSE